MAKLNPWINFNGNAEEAFTFYKSVLGGEITKIVRFKDLADSGIPVAQEEGDKIMQIALTLDDGQMLFGNDVPAFLGTVNERENRSKIHLQLKSKEETARVFTGLSEEGEVEGELGESPWGTYSGTFRDKYGIEWIIECTK